MPLSFLLLLGVLGLYLYLRGHLAQARARRVADPDAAPLDELARAGSDLSLPHEIEFFLYFPDQPAALRAARTLEAEGYQTEVSREGAGEDWLCFATREMVPDLGALRTLRARFNRLADADGGVYDGWGTTVTSTEPGQ